MLIKIFCYLLKASGYRPLNRYLTCSKHFIQPNCRHLWECQREGVQKLKIFFLPPSRRTGGQLYDCFLVVMWLVTDKNNREVASVSQNFNCNVSFPYWLRTYKLFSNNSAPPVSHVLNATYWLKECSQEKTTFSGTFRSFDFRIDGEIKHC